MYNAQPLGLRLSLHLRSRKPSGMVMLYARLSIGSTRSAEYKVDILAPLEAWQPKAQRVNPQHPQAETINALIADLRAEHERIYAEQKGAVLPNGSPFFVTVHSVIDQWRTSRSPVATLTVLDLYDEYLAYLKSLPAGERKATKTLKSYTQAGKYLDEFLRHCKQLDLPADNVTGGWGRRFHDWLRTKSMSAGTATRYFMAIKLAMQHAYNYDRVKANPLDTLRFKGDRKKPIHSLTAVQLEQLANLELSGTISDARQWALLMCYTGLDYHDALRVVKNVDLFRVDTVDGPKLIYQRLKYANAPQWGECHIPLLTEALELLSVASEWKQPKLRNQNDFLNEIGRMMNLPFSFSTKVCRKSAGAMFLREGFDIYGVQKILGHQSVKVTESHYCNLPAEVVNRQMKEVAASRRNQPVVSASVFRRMA